MENIMEKTELQILLISENLPNIQNIGAHLKKTIDMPCQLLHCQDVIRATGFFAANLRETTDIILLDLNFLSSEKTHEIFAQLQATAHDIPIIVFTERNEHELALFMMSEGAADNITKGQLNTDPHKLRDTIEFALARRKISEKTKQKNLDYLQDMRAHKEEALKDAKITSDIALEEAITENGKNLKDAKKNAKLELAHTKKEHTTQIKERDQIINWMSGGYSMEKEEPAPKVSDKQGA